jgi:hypothetical protein
MFYFQIPVDSREEFQTLVEKVACRLLSRIVKSKSKPTKHLRHFVSLLLYQWHQLLSDWPEIESQDDLWVAWTDKKYKLEDMEKLQSTTPATFDYLQATSAEQNNKKKIGRGKWLCFTIKIS